MDLIKYFWYLNHIEPQKETVTRVGREFPVVITGKYWEI
jgi:hypothetical protein